LKLKELLESLQKAKGKEIRDVKLYREDSFLSHKEIIVFEFTDDTSLALETHWHF